MSKTVLNKPVFYISAAGIVAVALWTIFAPESATSTVGVLFSWTTGWFGWLYIALATGAVVFLLYLAFSKYGHVRLGPKDSKPQYGTFTWAALLFAAGINIDLMFYAVGGPVAHYLFPPTGEGQTAEAAKDASLWTIFHYGVNGWALYALMGLALAYFAYRRNLPLAIRSALYPIFGKRVKGPIGHGVEIATIWGTIFGVATSLGIGVVQLNFGLQQIFGLPDSTAIQFALIALVAGVSLLSALSGVDRSITWLSKANVYMAVALALYVVIVGDTKYLLNALVGNIGDFFATLPARSVETFAFQPEADEWQGGWTLFFWAWWIAYATFIGLFLARISRGRTIRQFALGALLLPFSYIVMWISIFGNAAIGMIMDGNIEFGELAANYPEQGFYGLLAEYPWFTAVALVATLTGLLFYVTTADTGALVMGNITSHLPDPYTNSSNAARIFWGMTLAVLTGVMLVAGGVEVMQAATIVVALPMSFVLILVMVGLLKSLRAEHTRIETGRRFSLFQISKESPGRRKRQEIYPGDESPQAALEIVVGPALENLAETMDKQGIEVSVVRDNGSSVELVAGFGDGKVFRYRVEACAGPEEALPVTINGRKQLYEIWGYTFVQVIDDAAGRYDRVVEAYRTGEVLTGYEM